MTLCVVLALKSRPRRRYCMPRREKTLGQKVAFVIGLCSFILIINYSWCLKRKRRRSLASVLYSGKKLSLSSFSSPARRAERRSSEGIKIYAQEREKSCLCCNLFKICASRLPTMLFRAPGIKYHIKFYIPPGLERDDKTIALSFAKGLSWSSLLSLFLPLGAVRSTFCAAFSLGFECAYIFGLSGEYYTLMELEISCHPD